MKPTQTIALIVLCIALLTLVGFGLEFHENRVSNGLLVAILSTAVPLAAVVWSVYALVKSK